MTKLTDLYDHHNQSPWLDNLKREWILNGELQQWIDQGIRGITSNPAIFREAISKSSAYDDQIRDLSKQFIDIEEMYWELVYEDIADALDLMRPVYEASGGLDGYVSLEINPNVANQTDATISAAQMVAERLPSSNLHIKIPGTLAGIPAIEQLTSDKKNINVTLLFSLSRYEQVIDAYLQGLQRAQGDLSTINSVASFFVSRVDTAIDEQLSDQLESSYLRGKAALYNAYAAYELWKKKFSGEVWESLVARGAKPQRLLWASTGTKNPQYPDTYYLDELILPHTVTTVPDPTLLAFLDHGTVDEKSYSPDEVTHYFEELQKRDIDLESVTNNLEEAGVAAFVAAHQDLLVTLDKKRCSMIS